MPPYVFIIILAGMLGATPAEVDPWDPDNSKIIAEYLSGPALVHPGSPVPQPL